MFNVILSLFSFGSLIGAFPVVEQGDIGHAEKIVGDEIVFRYPEFTLREGNRTREGGLSLFQLGEDTVLQLKFMKKNGTIEEVRTYQAEIQENRESPYIIRSLILTPARMSVSGVGVRSRESIRFEQIEIIEDAGGE